MASLRCLLLLAASGCSAAGSGQPDAGDAGEAVPDACPGRDSDGDGYSRCGPDCDDSDDTVHPEAPEVCADCRDQDCDGVDEPCSRTAEVRLTPDPPRAGRDLEVRLRSEFAFFWLLLRIEEPSGAVRWEPCEACEGIDEGWPTWTFVLESVSEGRHVLTFTKENVGDDETRGTPVICTETTAVP